MEPAGRFRDDRAPEEIDHRNVQSGCALCAPSPLPRVTDPESPAGRSKFPA